MGHGGNPQNGNKCRNGKGPKAGKFSGSIEKTEENGMLDKIDDESREFRNTGKGRHPGVDRCVPVSLE